MLHYTQKAVVLAAALLGSIIASGCATDSYGRDGWHTGYRYHHDYRWRDRDGYRHHDGDRDRDNDDHRDRDRD